MKKLHFAQSFAKRAVAVGLSLAMIVPTVVAYVGATTADAEELPTPLAVYQAGDDAAVVADSGANKPGVVAAEDLGVGAKAWELKDSVAGEKFNTDSSITVANPFKGHTELVEELKTAVTDPKFGEAPVWTKGITITYWVKTADVENNNSALISFKGKDILTYHKDDIAKYRVAKDYTAEAGKDPNSEFYLKTFAKPYTKDGKDYPVYDFSEYWKAHGLKEAGDPPVNVGYNPEYAGKNLCYYYMGKVNADGTPAEEYKDGINMLALEQDKNDATKFATLDMAQGSWVRQAPCDSLLQLRADDSFFFVEDITKATNVNSNREDFATNNSSGMQFRNYAETGPDTEMTGDPGNWHFVAFVIQNDYVCAFLDGERWEVLDENTGAFASKSFNAGCGFKGYSAYGGKAYQGYYNSNTNAKSIMEWITQDGVVLNIGGASLETCTDYAGKSIATKGGTQIAKVSLYGEVLDDDVIASIFENNDGFEVPVEPTEEPTEEPAKPTDTPATEEPAKPTDTPATEEPAKPTDTPATDTPVGPTDTPATEEPAPSILYGDADQSGVVDANDALAVLKHVVKLETLEGNALIAADVNGKDGVEANDALEILKYVVKLIQKFEVEK